METNHPINEKF